MAFFPLLALALVVGGGALVLSRKRDCDAEKRKNKKKNKKKNTIGKKNNNGRVSSSSSSRTPFFAAAPPSPPVTPPTPAQRNAWTAFWAERIVEHFDALTDIQNLVGAFRTPEQKTNWDVAASTMMQHWKKTAQLASAGDSTATDTYVRDSWIEGTRQWKQTAQKRIRQASSDDECWPDLPTHMIEELDRMVRMRTTVPTLGEALYEWSQEHLEGDQLFSCQVMHELYPLKKDPRVRGAVTNIVVEAKALAAEFDTLAKRFATFRSTLRKGASGTLSQREEFLRLSANHRSLLVKLRHRLFELFLQQPKLLLIKKLVTHELAEAEWVAFLVSSLEPRE